MAGDESITNAELARRLDDRFNTVREDIREMDQKIDKLVPREVYELQSRGTQTTIDRLRQDVDALEEQRRQDHRMVISALVLPVLVFIIQYLLTSHGVKP